MVHKASEQDTPEAQAALSKERTLDLGRALYSLSSLGANADKQAAAMRKVEVFRLDEDRLTSVFARYWRSRGYKIGSDSYNKQLATMHQRRLRLRSGG